MKDKILIVLVALGLIGLISWAIMPTIPNTNKVQDIKYEEIKKEFDTNKKLKTEFVSGCVASDIALIDFCNCAFDVLLEELGTDKFITESIKYSETGIMPEAMYSAVTRCYTEY